MIVRRSPALEVDRSGSSGVNEDEPARPGRRELTTIIGRLQIALLWCAYRFGCHTLLLERPMARIRTIPSSPPHEEALREVSDRTKNPGGRLPPIGDDAGPAASREDRFPEPFVEEQASLPVAAPSEAIPPGDFFVEAAETVLREEQAERPMAWASEPIPPGDFLRQAAGAALPEEWAEVPATRASQPVPPGQVPRPEPHTVTGTTRLSNVKFSRAGRHSGWSCSSYLRTVRS